MTFEYVPNYAILDLFYIYYVVYTEARFSYTALEIY